MIKTGFNSSIFYADETFSLKDVSSLTITNYGAAPMIVTLNNVPEVVPPFDDVNNYAQKFVIDGDGTLSDMELQVSFPAKVGKAVLRYRQLLIKTC